MINRILTIVSVGLLFASCEEVPPPIDYGQSTKLKDSTYIAEDIETPQQKKVLLEDISGVRCVNCPDAAAIARDIVAAFPGRVYTIVMHPKIDALKTLVDPITKPGHISQMDFRTADAADILSQVGIPGSLPIGVINRKKFPDKEKRFVAKEEWYAKCNEELQSGSSPVNIHLENEYDEATHKGVITITLHYTQTPLKQQFLSLALIEDSLIDVQEYRNSQTQAAEYDNNYKHMHVLRDMITSFMGDPVTTGTEIVPGRVFVKEYEYTTHIVNQENGDQDFMVNPRYANIIAFVHEDVSSFNVLNVAEIHVKE